MIFENPNNKLDFFLKNFHSQIINWFSYKTSLVSEIDSKNLLDILMRIKNWESAKRYAEDIVSPRINWLLDLGLLSKEYLENGEVQLSLKGTKFISQLEQKNTWYIYSDVWLYKNFFRTVNFVYFEESLQFFDSLLAEDRENLMNEFFGLAFKKFGFKGFPRLSVEPTLFFIAISMLEQKHLLTDYEDILANIGFEKKLKDLTISFRPAQRKGESYFLVRNA